MTEPKFTPGPCTIFPEHNIMGQKYYSISYGDDDGLICEFICHKADAALIAAAPEMYAELERIADILEDPEDCGEISLDRINAILRKARGESEVSDGNDR